MRKLLICSACIATLLLAGCSADHIPWVHRIPIQQGNVVTQDMVNRLKPGMTRRQVRFVMGNPLVEDPFHADRWDYYYSYQPGGGKRTTKHVAVYFQGDKLARVSGDLRPGTTTQVAEQPKEVNVLVPQQPREERGILIRLWDAIRFWRHKDG